MLKKNCFILSHHDKKGQTQRARLVVGPFDLRPDADFRNG